MSSEHAKPTGFEDYLGEYEAQLFDSWCGEPVSWGFKITRHLGDERFAELRKYGSLECDHGYPVAGWYLIVKELTVEEATAKYGDITKVHVGPRGGFQTVTFGDKTFCVPKLRPDLNFKDDPRVEWDPPTEAMKALEKKRKLKKAAKERAKARKLAKKEK